MTKSSPKQKSAMQKRQLRSSGSKYLTPGTLAAQVRYSRSSNSKPRFDIGKIPLGSGSSRKDNDKPVENSGMLSPVNLIRQSSVVGTPKTPQADVYVSESRLESLPMDVLTSILCHLHHDELKAVFHVSQRVRKAVIMARQDHFDYTTPDSSRQQMLNRMTPRPPDRYPFLSRGGNGFRMPTPHTPKAPRHGPRPSNRPRGIDMRQVAAVLFQESVLPPRRTVPPVMAKPCKPLASSRVLSFYEEELCQAVAQNKLSSSEAL